MNAKKTILAGLLGLTLAALPAASHAYDWDKEMKDAGPHGGLSIGGEASRYVNDHVIDNDWYYGANLRLHFGPVMAVEGSADYRRSAGNDLYPAQGSVLFYLWPHRLAPYILGGGTWYFRNGGPASHTLFGPHAGAGAELYVMRHVSLDVNWRYHWVEDIGSGSNYFNRSYSTNGSQWRMGVNFYF